ncbi:hypothetical protein A3D84_02175 [Candidatus Woesebacteria bacterium RIFCSPHIGHO2_02_FULL_42_20]|uniref:Uncharacterized protein n=1 Tax=Candidatus Woesebacteria bacterium RIFCSPHIGHO2_12_FULL_41_24 TaxID=1802510 RepID=A0A1F8ASY8_9BACT|nr:MAG: hypothetical protein A2W15_04455 [Candidatus Woesebacteria bacterium RBG_16_41_13]OGM28998.1 MAG: hypothetical protein A2873_01610 [Candidatus Woesebacteria bacterium RIFCSPHIGHO2_01_FULL_42_80]OGM35130.1 MAG: hypothetical protein A3D84_02175 [Candidatus Woesebacteria bacterium RIFCSPHIGHO2_02_FULL_42_20]OGM54866.1 MAG: hypothetical protein A3E44_01775 [Candidatus Woesebacteria bacterium RIFCSPHIGHO2_12_FULL_41_24]OGM66658.1 MAG: hypothetical protein A2969_03230 [Candidatus Woesebacteri
MVEINTEVSELTDAVSAEIIPEEARLGADEALSRLGLETKRLMLLPFIHDEQHVFVTNNPNIYTRFHRPRIDKNQELPPSNIVKIEEWIAGIAPFIAVVPEKSQDRIEAFFANDVLAEGQVARVEGVVIQQNYSNPLLDAFGLSRYLRHPDIGIHIYDESGAFAQKINMHFIDTKTAKRIDTINDQAQQMSPDQIATTKERLNRVFTALEEDGVTERLVENQHSIGQIADIRGLSVIDLAEICLKYKSEQEWLENTDLNSIANMTPTQLAVLRLRKQGYQKGVVTDGEPILPSDMDIIKHAVELARENGDEQIADSLQMQLLEAEGGLKRYQHNIGRGGIFRKLDHAEIEEGYLTFFGLLDKILKSGRLIPRKATYSKGTYLQSVSLHKDDPNDLYNFVLYAMNPGERVKNIRARPLIIEIADRHMPTFKHQQNVVKYVPTSLHGSLRRVIVHGDEQIDRVGNILKESGYEDVSVCSVDIWSREIEYLKAAKDRSMADLISRVDKK